MNPFPPTITDIHTHSANHTSQSIYNVRLGLDQTIPDSVKWISAGIHPWDTAQTTSRTDILLSQLEYLVKNDPRLIAIGECGLDTLAGGSQAQQETIFKIHTDISERYGKPLIIHCVRSFDRLLHLNRHIRPNQPWIVHGFRGKPTLALQLARAGIGMSLGEYFNTETARTIPPGLLFTETDESSLTIEEIRNRIAKARGM
ncbi:MAG: TatD family hydrolase [Muribaculaceae bacterium]|nr:TatD family hydrolase [Muribaculaceae bacterium]